jgi:restriction system protein
VKEEGWYQFQELVREHFESLGADAETNVRLQGVRTCHDVDVLVKTKFLGEDITWLVEAKFWKTPVSKLHVLALRTMLMMLELTVVLLFQAKVFNLVQ